MKALVIIDVQNDFMPSGALPVPKGDEVVAAINRELHKDYATVVATQDWHPADHLSFAANHKGKQPFEVIDLNGISQVLWPTHCVQGSLGAALHPELNTRPIAAIFRKGMQREVDSYSAFFDNQRQHPTGLHGYLQEKGITELTFCGLAGDYCVAYSVNDALSLGYKVQLLTEGIRAINAEDFDRYRRQWGF